MAAKSRRPAVKSRLGGAESLEERAMMAPLAVTFDVVGNDMIFTGDLAKSNHVVFSHKGGYVSARLPWAGS
jgi:hypothetical protein